MRTFALLIVGVVVGWAASVGGWGSDARGQEAIKDPVSDEKVGDGKIPKENEIVMAPRSRIDARTSVGEISIIAGKGLRRTYEWDGASRSVEMWPREERWYGSMGLYFPGPGSHWKNHNGVTRGVVEEGQRHFKDEAAAMAWLKEDSTNYHPIVWNAEGLVVGWSKTLPRQQLNVDVWQIYIDGEKPTVLEGATDDAVKYSVPK